MLGKLIHISTHHDLRGPLYYLEFEKLLGFSCQRTYWITDCQIGSSRGFHAHKNLKQFAVAIHGAFEFLLDNGYDKKSFVINSPECGLLIESLVWREFKATLPDSILLVFASELYSEDDYIRKYSNFLKYVRKLP